MANKKRKIAVSCAAVSLAFALSASFIISTDVKASSSIKRMEGKERVETANKAAEKLFGSADTVILVNGWVYEDAASAIPLSKQLNAPMLLTKNNGSLEQNVRQTIDFLAAKKIILIGNNKDISYEIESELSSRYEVTRIENDNDNTRIGTNASVAKEVLKSSKADTAILVNGVNGYADALTVASAAAVKGFPVLFCSSNEIPKSVENIIDGHALKILAVGGKGVVPEHIVDSVGGRRIAEGQDRFDTNLKVLKYFKNDLDFNNMYIAAGGRGGIYGENDFADALVASAAAAKIGSPVILTGLGADLLQKKKASQYVKENKKQNTEITIIGGPASVDYGIEYSMDNIVQPDEDEIKLKIASIDVLNLKQIEINFNKKVTDEEKKKIEDEDNYILEDEDDDEISDIIDEVKVSDNKKFATITFDDEFHHGKYVVKEGKKYNLIIDEEVLGEKYEEELKFEDLENPRAQSAEVVDLNTIRVNFNKPVMPYNNDSECIDEEFFEINKGDVEIYDVDLIDNNTAAEITLSNDLKHGDKLNVEIKDGIDDYSGNRMESKIIQLVVDRNIVNLRER